MWGGKINRRVVRFAAMKQRFFAFVLGGLLACSVVSGAQPPNFVVIVADDMGWRDPAFMGSDYHQTPHMDRLAADGLVFTQAYANAPVCAPTRAAILSGQYAARTGVYTVGRAPRETDGLKLRTPRNVESLDPGLITLPEALKAAGYKTGLVGKWHLGRPTGATGPEAHGFDVAIGTARGGGTRTYYAPYGISSLDGDAPEGQYLTNRLTDEAVGFIQDHKDRPFFLWLSHYAVHTPIEADPKVLAQVKKRPAGDLHDHAEYAAMVESFDQSVGRVVEALGAAGLAENTVVVFGSDNGGSRRVTRMTPLKGNKGSLSEGGVRVPCVVKYPGVVEPGRTTDTPVLLFDLFPTLLDLAEAGLSAEAKRQPVDGVSWAPLLRGQPAPGLTDRPLVWHIPVYKTRPGGRIAGSPATALRKGRWKLMYDYESKTSELYDLQADVGETKDLSDAEPGVAQELERELAAWQRRVDAELPTPNPDYDPQKAVDTERRGRRRDR